MGWKSVRAIGLCDYSSKLVPHQRLKKQMEYNGKGLYNTNYLVAPEFLDKPNPQNLAFQYKIDPVIVKNPRPDPETFNENTPHLVFDVTGKSEIIVVSAATAESKKQLEEFQSCYGIDLVGIASGNIALVLPYVCFEIYIDLLFSSGFDTIVTVKGTPFSLHVNEPSQLISFDGSFLRKVNSYGFSQRYSN